MVVDLLGVSWLMRRPLRYETVRSSRASTASPHAEAFGQRVMSKIASDGFERVRWFEVPATHV